jgi:hypothetical protein
MSNHRVWTWDHRGSKPLGPKLLSVGHHLDGYLLVFLIERERECWWCPSWKAEIDWRNSDLRNTPWQVKVCCLPSTSRVLLAWATTRLSTPLLSSQLLPSIYNRDHHGSDWMKDLPLDSIRLLFYILKKFPFNFFFIFIPSMESINWIKSSI